MDDNQKIRKQFPILKRQFNQHPLVYLDNASTTQKPERVIEAISSFYRKHNANVHRAMYQLSEEASSLYEGARKKTAHFIGAEEEEVIFTRSTTEAINMLALAWSERYLREGDTVVLSEMEHHSNIVPWYLAAKRQGASINWVSLQNGEIDRDSFQKALESNPAMVALTHVSNVLGTTNPLQELIGLAHAAGAQVLIDGAQAVARRKVAFCNLDADFYVFGAHKMYGPTGIGVLCGKKQLLDDLYPVEGGGSMISRVTKEKISFRRSPARFEYGTPPIAEAVALAEAIDWLSEIGLETIWKHEQDLLHYAKEGLLDCGVNLYQPNGNQEAILSFEIEGVHAHDVAEILNRYGIAVRSGHHCAQILMNSLGVSALTRVSFAPYNTKEEIDLLLSSLERVRKIFAK